MIKRKGFIKFVLGLVLAYNSFAQATVTTEWELQGEDLHYVITSANYPSGGNKNMSCGFLGGSCFVQLGLSTVPFQDVEWKDYVSLRGSQTFGAVADAWSDKYIPRRGVILNWVSLNAIKPRCINLYISSDISGSAYLGNTCNGTMNPPPVVPPTPPLSCYIDGAINIVHGILNDNALDGSTKIISSRVYCTGPAMVKITALSSQGGDVVKLRPDGSLSSQLKVNGINGYNGATIFVPGTGGVSLQFSSTLIANGNVSPGDFTGSALAVVTII
ncbi:MrpH family fimbial adhesin [Serratia fonticola]